MLHTLLALAALALAAPPRPGLQVVPFDRHTTYLIDPEGNIIGVLSGAENWTAPDTLQYFENLLKSQ